jgi:hypothetical protein
VAILDRKTHWIGAEVEDRSVVDLDSEPDETVEDVNAAELNAQPGSMD